jgi:outer membrane protein OmpA-like peptidoglycan-associated protein
MKSNRIASLTLGHLATIGLVAACASAPPPRELLDARAAYSRAQAGPAQQLAPATMHDAKVALNRAEQSYSDDSDSQKTRDLGYIAERKVELAEAQASTAQATHDAAIARAHGEQREKAQLAQAKEQVDAERQARMAAEQRARDALNNLSTVAANVAVKNDTRGTVITIPGSVLFATGKTDLLPGAQSSLDKVADALKDQEGSQIAVNGFTDSTGTEEKNMQVSQDRADHVRDYLVSHGVPAENVKAQGFGPSQPIADNTTAAGRAMNRRVEIVVQNQGEQGQRQQSPSERWRQGQQPDQR